MMLEILAEERYWIAPVKTKSDLPTPAPDPKAVCLVEDEDLRAYEWNGDEWIGLPPLWTTEDKEKVKRLRKVLKDHRELWTMVNRWAAVCPESFPVAAACRDAIKQIDEALK